MNQSLNRIVFILLSVFISPFSLVNQLNAQGCTGFYGPTGIPNSGLNFYVCSNPASVQLDATVTFGTPTYAWPSGGTNAIETVTATGTYTVTLTQGGSSCQVTFTVVDTNQIPNLGPDTAICSYDSIQLDAGTNGLFNSVTWMGGQTVDTIWATSGLYAVEVSDGNSCTARDTIAISPRATIPLNVSADTAICAGDTTTLSALSTGYATYLWSTASTAPTIQVSANGKYYITATDTAGCVTDDSVQVTHNQLPTPTISQNTGFCQNDSITLNPGSFTSYSWSTGAVSPTISVNSAGAYWVNVIDLNGCSAADTANISVFSLPVVNIGQDTSICLSAPYTIFASTGNLGDVYLWQDNSSADTMFVDQGGTYTLSIVDTNNCSSFDSIVVQSFLPPLIFLGNDTAICIGDTLTLDAGAGMQSYQWTTTEITQTIDVTAADTFGVLITDNNGCENFDNIIVTHNLLPTPTVADDSICIGDSVIVNGGNGFTAYAWSTGGMAQMDTISTNGTYAITVTDNNQCQGADTFDISLKTQPTVTLGVDTNICFGDSITLDAGAGFNAFAWSTGEMTQTISVDTSSSYSVTVTAANACTASDTQVVVVKSLPTPSLGPDLFYCENGTLFQVVTPGPAFNAYLWNDGTNATGYLANETDSLVWVEVTDNFSCKGRDTLMVIENPLPTVNIGPDDTICIGQSITLSTTTQGSAVQSYAWSTGASTSNITINGTSTAVSGSYSLTVTDTNTCQNGDTMILQVNLLPQPDLGNDTSYCIGDAFNVTLTPGAFTQYAWSDGSTNPFLNITAVQAGYSVTVTDGAGCQNSDSYQVTENALPSPFLGNDTTYCENEGITLILDPGSYDQYNWSTGSTSSAIVVTTDGNYKVTVTDLNGCSNLDSILITENLSPFLNLGADQLYCEGDTLSDTLDASASLPGVGFSYQWSTGINSPIQPATVPGTYAVTVTNNFTGCQSTDDVTIALFEKADPKLEDEGIICNSEVVTVDPEVSIAGYTYLWNTGATTSTINVLNPGLYWVELNAENGTCLNIRDSIELKPGVLPVVELGPDQSNCVGQDVSLLNGQSPFPDATYTWQDGSTDPYYIAEKTGVYEVTVSNRCGSVIDFVYLEFVDCSNVWVPNAFTPNGDGKNDIFLPETDQQLQDYTIRIFDRYGHLVFISNDPGFGWDGTVNGEDAESGTYTWRLNYFSAFTSTFERQEMTGSVLLVH